MDPQELVPLEEINLPAAISPRHKASRHCSLAARSCLRGPLRLCRLLAMLIVLPSLFLLVPLYLRYRVYSGQMYPMSMTDMRLIDSKISPMWCQRQVVRSNATFNAFVVPGAPTLTDQLVPVSMTRELTLEDDMKEYWGFYLLKGSTVTVSACVRWPGASLIMIKGYKHLQECAYIGDDSSEELDELLEANKLGLLSNTTLLEKLQELKKNEGKANDPGTMKRHKPGVSFHDPSHSTNVTSQDSMPTVDVTDHDPKELREILEHLHSLRQAAKVEISKHYRPPSHLMSLPALHRHRDANVDRDERRWLSFKDIDGNNSEQTIAKVKNTSDLHLIKTNQSEITTTKQTLYFNQNSVNINEVQDSVNDNQMENSKVTQEFNKADQIAKIDFIYPTEVYIKTEAELDEIEEEINGNNSHYNNKHNGRAQNSEELSSREVFEDVLKRLHALGNRGKRVLKQLYDTMGVDHHEKPSTQKEDIMSSVTGSSEELDWLRKVLVEAIDEEKTRTQREQKRRVARENARAKRELMLGQIELTKDLNEDDEARNYAAEEDLEPDGYAEHHETVNETTVFDMSNSEFWSSFSSSEEALLECEGLILNLPLTPHTSCFKEASDDATVGAARANALTYRVPANGYYFFVFNSENEVQENYIRARFDLQKTRYDVARTKLRECTNTTDRCDLTLDIFSSQKVILEVPLRDNDSLWNEQFVILSECEPRTSVYIFCVIAIPVLILIFGFQ